MNEVESTSRPAPTTAQQQFDIALSAHQTAEARYEDTLISGLPSERAKARLALRDAASALAQARTRLVTQSSETAPSFEDLLRNPLAQVDVGGTVLNSIRQYWAQAAVQTAASSPSPASPSVTGHLFTRPTATPVAAGFHAAEAPTPGRTEHLSPC